MDVAEKVTRKARLALMFPGQGSQFAGMAMDLVAASPSGRAVLEEADEIMGYPLSRIMAGDLGDELNRTIHTQPAIFVHSMALLAVLREHCSFVPVIAAGHSLGEYSALCTAGVLSFQESLEVIKVRARGMDEAQPRGSCAMVALIGLTKEDAALLVEQHRGDQVLEAANFNAPDQIVISGHIEAVNRALEAAKKGRRTRAHLLPVSSAFHTRLMEPARESLARKLREMTPGPPAFPVLANLNAQTYPAASSGVKDLLTEQVVNPVRWEECVRAMLASEADVFVEIGPGKVLTGLLKRIDRSAEAINLHDLESIRSFAHGLA
jgi:[acyl-carrier-protein] S-malonyltransferase